MAKDPMIIDEHNLSVAWGKAFLGVMQCKEIAPLVVTIKGLGNETPPEVPAIRSSLDHVLKAEGKGLCHTVANTIFPSMWNRQRNRLELYRRYLKILPRLRKHRGNRHGLYFERLISFGHNDDHKCGFNQLEHVIETWKRGNRRRTALQAGLFDPLRDHNHRRQHGFPCLQQVAFAHNGSSELTVTGFYATQYIFERAYGNYLGLCRLGLFMAHGMGLRLDRVTCIATPAVRGKLPKYKLKPLAERVEVALDKFHSDAAASRNWREHD